MQKENLLVLLIIGNCVLLPRVWEQGASNRSITSKQQSWVELELHMDQKGLVA